MCIRDRKEELEQLSRDELAEKLRTMAEENYKLRETVFGEENMRELEKMVMLKVVDAKWMEHLDHMDMLREGIGLRAYGQRNPLIEYKMEAYDMFQAMVESIQEDIAKLIFRVNIVSEPAPELTDRLKTAKEVRGGEEEAEAPKKQPIVNTEDIGRNELCPCGSGKKYKKCCGKNR